DHEKNETFFITLANDEKEASVKFMQLKNILKHPPAAARGAKPAWKSGHTENTYERSVRKVIDYIRAGDIFQVNLSQRFEAHLPDGFSPFGHYKALRRVNPAPFAAYMNFGSMILSSASPERFLQARGRQVETRPIKGTRPRLPDPAQDKKIRAELSASEKDRAENIMIVDLLRNDLSKACTDESVKTQDLCRLESFARVHHLVSTVTGYLRADKTPLDLLEACFPGGSITGAPKVRAMEIIEELELQRRGPYCGAMGYIGFDGAMDMNIAIRTLVYEGQKVSFNAGGGITADSDPAAEYRETMDKAEGIFRSFEVLRRDAVAT
ncbi:MAG: aminodeoxychorismate synthase component I, partial [Proteobacteria bacterium]|nr:aminodeoxychorismate synthase component I [Pseudomonadota bacterium]